MGTFDPAWKLLKQRDFEVMPRQKAAGPSLAPTMQQQLEALVSGDFSQVEEAERLEERRNKTEEREIDPMTRHLLNQQAEDIEAEGIELPDMPSSGPPADTDYGRAGSTSSEPIRPRFNPFDPNEVALRRQTMANEQTPLGQALAQARSQSPQPLQFEKAWTVLKSRTNRDYPFTPSGRAGKQTQYSPNFTGNTIPLVGEGVDRTLTDTSSHGGRPISSSTRRAREKENMQQMMRDESAPNPDEEDVMPDTADEEDIYMHRTFSQEPNRIAYEASPEELKRLQDLQYQLSSVGSRL